jgi:ribonuclease BN (tRNA processing enzyme)
VKLTVVGCAPAYTLRVGRASSCYLVEDGESAIVLDLGQGTLPELGRYRRPEDVAGVLISHLHADHLVDLIPLRHYLVYEVAAPDRVAAYGPAELRPRLDAFQATAGFLDCLPGSALEPGAFELGAFRVEARRVTHIEDSFAFRVTPAGSPVGPGLVYSGDCAVADDLLPLLHEGDTLVCEAAFGGGPKGGGMHLTAAEAAGVAAAGRVERLVLTHILDRNDEGRAREAAAAVFNGELLVASPGLALEVS